MLSRKTLCALVVTLFCAVGTASAQDQRGTLTGTVTDSSGAVLPGVTLVMKNTETGIAQQVVTDSDGRYQFLYVNPGTYSVAAELTGFKRFVNALDPHIADVVKGFNERNVLSVGRDLGSGIFRVPKESLAVDQSGLLGSDA